MHWSPEQKLGHVCWAQTRQDSVEAVSLGMLHLVECVSEGQRKVMTPMQPVLARNNASDVNDQLLCTNETPDEALPTHLKRGAA